MMGARSFPRVLIGYSVCPHTLAAFERAGRMVDGRERWANQTDSGQNRLSPNETRWLERSRTLPGLAAAMGDQWGRYLVAFPDRARAPSQLDLFAA